MVRFVKAMRRRYGQNAPSRAGGWASRVERGAVQTYEQRLESLSLLSVRRRQDPFTAVPWDDPEMALDAHPETWELPSSDPLGSTAWYQGQSAAQRQRVGRQVTLYMAASGLTVECFLQQGLAHLAAHMPPSAPELRYVQHEIIEEGQHILMFRELVVRAGVEFPAFPWAGWFSDAAARYSKEAPELFLLAVMAAEEPFDHMQREMLQGATGHPLVRRVCAVHVADEARHLSFARLFIARRFRGLDARGQRQVRDLTPLVIPQISQLFFQPVGLTERCGVPPEVVEAIYSDEAVRPRVATAVARLTRFCEEVGIIDERSRRIWVHQGLLPGPEQSNHHHHDDDEVVAAGAEGANR